MANASISRRTGADKQPGPQSRAAGRHAAAPAGASGGRHVRNKGADLAQQPGGLGEGAELLLIGPLPVTQPFDRAPALLKPGMPCTSVGTSPITMPIRVSSSANS